MSEERLSTVYHLVSTNSEKVRVGSEWGGDLGSRLGFYKWKSTRESDAISKWIKGVGADSLRTIPMVVRVCTMREVRIIDTYGCELNPIGAYTSEEDKKEAARVRTRMYTLANPDMVREGKKTWHEANRERCNQISLAYRKANWRRISERKVERVLCGCGFVVTRGSLSGHRRSTKHLS